MSSAENKQLMQDNFARAHDGARKTIPLRFIADGDLVVVEARREMTSKTGTLYNNEYCMIYRLRAACSVLSQPSASR